MLDEDASERSSDQVRIFRGPDGRPRCLIFE
jgi:hypothetical protein